MYFNLNKIAFANGEQAMDTVTKISRSRKLPEKFSPPGREKTDTCIFTMIELLVVIAIIAIFAAILLPALNSAREKAFSVTCLSNWKQIGTAMQQYFTDGDEWMPFCNYTMESHPYVGNDVANWDAKNRGIILVLDKAYLRGSYTKNPYKNDFNNIWSCPGKRTYFERNRTNEQMRWCQLNQFTAEDSTHPNLDRLFGGTTVPPKKLKTLSQDGTSPAKTILFADISIQNNSQNSSEDHTSPVHPGWTWGAGHGDGHAEMRNERVASAGGGGYGVRHKKLWFGVKD